METCIFTGRSLQIQSLDVEEKEEIFSSDETGDE